MADRTWGGGTNNPPTGTWSTAANWTGDSVPSSAEKAIFDGTATTNCSIDGNITVGSLEIAAGYSGTISHVGYLIVNSNVSQAAGTWNASKAVAITGTLTVTGGTLNITSGSALYFSAENNITLSGGSVTLGTGGILRGYKDITISNGVLNAGTGTVQAYGGGTWNTGTNSLYDTWWGAYSMAVTGTMTVTHLVTMAGSNYTSGTIEFTGNIASNGSYGSGLVKWTGSGSSTVSNNSGTGALPKFEVAGSGTLTFSNDMQMRDLYTETSGTIDYGTSTIDFWTTGNLGSFATSFKNVKITTGSVTLTGTMTMTGSLTIAGGTWSSGTWAVGGDVTTTNANTSTTAITLNGTGTQTITAGGTYRVGTGTFTINKSSGTVELATAFTLSGTGQDVTVTAGTLDLKGYDFTVNDVLTVSSGAGLKLTGDNSLSIGTATLNAASTVTYTATSGSRNVQNWTYGKLTINGFGGTFTLGANLTCNGLFTMTNGTVTCGSYTVATGGYTQSSGSVTSTSATWTISAGDWNITGGTFTHNSGTVAFGGTGTRTITSNGNNFYVLQGTTTSTIVLGDALRAESNMTSSSSSGFQAPSGRSLRVDGNFSWNGVVEFGSGTHDFYGSFATTGSNMYAGTSTINLYGTGKTFQWDVYLVANAICNLNIKGTYSIAASVGIAGTLTIDASCVLTIGSSVWVYLFTSGKIVNNGGAGGIVWNSSAALVLRDAVIADANAYTGTTVSPPTTVLEYTTNTPRTLPTFSWITDLNFRARPGITFDHILNLSGTYTLAGRVLVEAADAYYAKIVAGSANITCSGIDFIGAGAGTEIIEAGSGTWTITSNAAHSFDTTNGTFTAQTSKIKFAGTGTVTWTVGGTFYNVEFGASKTHTFTAGQTYRFDGTVSATGAVATLRSSSAGTHYNWNLQGTSALGALVDVQDCDASTGNTVEAIGSVGDGANNDNWLFTAGNEALETENRLTLKARLTGERVL